jgi:hypothetical protein
LKGHDFNRAAHAAKDAGLYRLRKNSYGASVLKGHGFGRAASAAILARALAPEGCFPNLNTQTRLFPQPVKPMSESLMGYTISEFSLIKEKPGRPSRQPGSS